MPNKDPEPLIPPDLKQCQAYPNVLGHSFMTLGMWPEPRRCTNSPVFIGVEKTPGPDGLTGAMSLCSECAQLCVQHLPKVEFIGIKGWQQQQEEKNRAQKTA